MIKQCKYSYDSEHDSMQTLMLEKNNHLDRMNFGVNLIRFIIEYKSTLCS